MLDRGCQCVLIGKKNGCAYWFARGAYKKMAELLQTIDPENYLHAPYLG